ncbi:MAG: DUF167 family protein [bacterium]|nr:DUF167 family protein [bacterium]
MKIVVTAKPGARKERVEKISETEYIVAVRELPVDGKANAAILAALAAYFKVSRANVRIVIGHTTKKKIIGITGI